MPKGEIPQSTRNRTPEQEVMYASVKRFFAFQKARMSFDHQFRQLVKRGYMDKESADVYTRSDEYKAIARWEQRELGVAITILRTTPIWQQWLTHVDGIGETLGAQLVALIAPISDFPTVSHLYSYGGHAVQDGEAVRRKAGQKSNWNPDLKRAIWLCGESFVKKTSCFYRPFYEAERLKQRQRHPEPVKDGSRPKYTDGHLYARAKRKARKLFISHLAHVWREIEGLPVRDPYPIEHLGHTTFIDPWEVVAEQKTVIKATDLVAMRADATPEQVPAAT